MKSIFDHIDNILYYKKRWNSLNEEEQKTANMFMITRYLSMEYEYITIINESQTLGLLPSQLYDLYISVIPKNKKYINYIKKSVKETKGDIPEILAEIFQVSEREAKDYILLLNKNQLKEIELQVKGIKEKKKK